MNSSVADRLSLYGPSRRHVLNELCTREIARKIIQPGDAVIDCGANEGFHVRDFVNLVGLDGIVHVFEPNPSLWMNLVGLDRVRLWPFAVGDAISIERFYVPEDDTHHQVGSIVDPRDFMGAVSMRLLSVPQVRIDALPEIIEKRVTFIKIDVERRELNCLRGARHLFEIYKPVVVFENSSPDIESLLADYGYCVEGMILNEPMNIQANVVAIPISRIEQKSGILLLGENVVKLMDWVELQYTSNN